MCFLNQSPLPSTTTPIRFHEDLNFMEMVKSCILVNVGVACSTHKIKSNMTIEYVNEFSVRRYIHMAPLSKIIDSMLFDVDEFPFSVPTISYLIVVTTDNSGSVCIDADDIKKSEVLFLNSFRLVLYNFVCHEGIDLDLNQWCISPTLNCYKQALPEKSPDDFPKLMIKELIDSINCNCERETIGYCTKKQYFLTSESKGINGLERYFASAYCQQPLHLVLFSVDETEDLKFACLVRSGETSAAEILSSKKRSESSYDIIMMLTKEHDHVCSAFSEQTERKALWNLVIPKDHTETVISTYAIIKGLSLCNRTSSTEILSSDYFIEKHETDVHTCHSKSVVECIDLDLKRHYMQQKELHISNMERKALNSMNIKCLLVCTCDDGEIKIEIVPQQNEELVVSVISNIFFQFPHTYDMYNISFNVLYLLILPQVLGFGLTSKDNMSLMNSLCIDQMSINEKGKSQQDINRNRRQCPNIQICTGIMHNRDRLTHVIEVEHCCVYSALRKCLFEESKQLRSAASLLVKLCDGLVIHTKKDLQSYNPVESRDFYSLELLLAVFQDYSEHIQADGSMIIIFEDF